MVSSSERLEQSCASASPSRYIIETDASRMGWGGGGGSTPGGANRGIVVSNEQKVSHQLFGAPTRILSCEKLHKESLMCPCEASNGQHFGCSVSRTGK